MNTAVNHSSGSEIASVFGKKADNYHAKAVIQKKVAHGLAASLKPWKDIVPPGPILEVGCGTGFLTELIADEFSEREMHVTDASEKMVSYTRDRLGEYQNLTFDVLDAELIEEPEEKYALIISNFAAQWFSDTARVLEKLGELLLPGGLLLISFPGNHSFEQWYEKCLELGLPYTANPLPDVEEVVIKLSMGPMQIDYYENDLYQDFESSLEFFRHLKDIGAGNSISGKSLKPKQLKLLTNHWDKSVDSIIKIKWHVVYLAAKKDLR